MTGVASFVTVEPNVLLLKSGATASSRELFQYFLRQVP